MGKASHRLMGPKDAGGQGWFCRETGDEIFEYCTAKAVECQTETLFMVGMGQLMPACLATLNNPREA